MTNEEIVKQVKDIIVDKLGVGSALRNPRSPRPPASPTTWVPTPWTPSSS